MLCPNNLYRQGRPKYHIQSPAMTIVYVGELMTEKLEKVSILSSAQEASTKMTIFDRILGPGACFILNIIDD